jgi:hypothetical protein
MPGLVLALDAGVQCTHLAKGLIGPGQTRVLLGGQPAATTVNRITVAGCPFTIPPPTGPKPQPCVTVTWGSVSAKVTAGGVPLLLGTPGTVPGVCQSAEQIPQGPPLLTSVQPKVSAQ